MKVWKSKIWSGELNVLKEELDYIMEYLLEFVYISMLKGRGLKFIIEIEFFVDKEIEGI